MSKEKTPFLEALEHLENMILTAAQYGWTLPDAAEFLQKAKDKQNAHG